MYLCAFTDFAPSKKGSWIRLLFKQPLFFIRNQFFKKPLQQRLYLFVYFKKNFALFVSDDFCKSAAWHRGACQDKRVA